MLDLAIFAEVTEDWSQPIYRREDQVEESVRITIYQVGGFCWCMELILCVSYGRERVLAPPRQWWEWWRSGTFVDDGTRSIVNL